METIFTTLMGMPKAVQIYAYACMIVGFCVTPVIIGFLARPLLRGWSYGLYNAVLYYKGGAHWGHIALKILRAIFVEPLLFINNSMQSTSNNMSSWYGIFGWHFKKEYNRKASKIYNAQCKAEREAKRKQAMEDDI